MSRILATLMLLIVFCLGFPFWSAAELVDGTIPQSINSVDFLSGDEGILPAKFSGAAVYSVKIDVPAGRNGMQPKLVLKYNSMFRDSWAGFGWQFEFGAIERNTKFGVNFGDDEFVYRTSDGAYELVKISSSEFRLKIEGRFLRFQRETGFDGKPVWIMTDKQGVQYTFGQDGYSRQDNPADDGQIFRWCLDRVEDRNGNYMTASYFKDFENNYIYLERIDYTEHAQQAATHSVHFILEGRADLPDWYRLKFREKVAYRLSAIDVKSNGYLVKRYDMTYSESPVSGRSMLDNIKIIGRNGTSELRTIDFDYSISSPAITPSLGEDIWTAEGSFWDSYPRDIIPADLDGDGRQDLVAGPFERYLYVYKSDGTKFTKGVYSSDLYAEFSGMSGSIFAADVTGDGNQEIIIGPKLIYSENDPGSTITDSETSNEKGDPIGGGEFYIIDYENGSLVNKGSWNEALPEVWGGYGGSVHVADMNGDGREDIVIGPSESGDWRLLLSDGNRFVDQGIVLQGKYSNFFPQQDKIKAMDVNGNRGDELVLGPDHNGHFAVLEYSSEGFLDLGYWYAGTMLGNPDPDRNQTLSMDLNGDKLIDLLIINNLQGVYYALLSTGSSFKYQGVWMSGKYGSGNPTEKPSYFPTDVNGDGLLDLMINYYSPGQWFYLRNTGSTFIDEGWLFRHNNKDVIAFPFDGNGDGRQGVFVLTMLPTTTLTGYFLNVIEPDNNKKGDLLKEVRNGIGGTTKLTYAPSASFPNARLPFPIPVVKTIERNDGNSNISTTSYDYSGGYYHHIEKDFRGFSYVKETGEAGDDGEQKVTQTYYLQGNGLTAATDDPSVEVGYLKGKPVKTLIKDGNGHLYEQTDITFAAPDQDKPYYFVPPQRVVKTICDAAGDCGVRDKKVYAYDEYGNVTRKEEWGDPTDSSDDRTTVTEYSLNTYDWLVGLPFRETLYAGIGTDEKTAQTTYDYDSGDGACGSSGSNPTPTKGNVSRITRWLDTGDDPQELFGYDDFGNQVCSKDARGNVSFVSYDDDTHSYPRVVTNAKGQSLISQYYGVDGQSTDNGLYGQLKSITDPNGAQKVTEYDVFGRKVRDQLSDGSWATWAYNNFGTVGAQHARLQNSLGLWYEIYFDGQGRPIKTRQPGPGDVSGTNVIATGKTYDRRGLLKKESLPYFEGGTVFNKVNSYDPLGRLLRVDKPDGSSEQSCYGYDGSVVQIDANRHKKRQLFDSRNRLVRVDEYQGAYSSCSTAVGSSYATTFYQYDSLDNLTQVENATGNLTKLTYDSLGRKITMRDPDMGNWSYGFDAAGNLNYQRDGKGQMILFEYDALNRLTKKSYATGGLVIAAEATNAMAEHTFGYLGNNELFLPSVLSDKVNEDGLVIGSKVLFSYDDPTRSNSVGRISQMVDDSGSTDYYYVDPLARKSRVDRTIDGQTYGITTEADAMQRTKAITYPDGTVVPYLYDPAGNLWHVGDYAEFSEYNAFGRAKKVSYQNGVTADYNYLAENGRLQSSRVGTATADYINRQYGYFANGNVKTIADALDSDRSQSFGYDSLDRIKTAESVIYGALTYDYDQLGNLTHKEGIDFITDTAQKPHQLVSSSNGRWYDYDANGNMLSDGVRSFEYDAENRPVSISYSGQITEFVYDGLGNRVKKSGPQGDRLYIGKLVEKTGLGMTKFIFAGQQRIALVSDLTTFYYHQDHLGGTSVVTDSSGNKVEQMFYKPFGELVEDVGTVSVTHKYTGQELDAETDLYFYNARYYNPGIGRFVSADTIVPHPFNPQSLNRYSYVLNNPVKLVDPTGHAESDADGDGDGDDVDEAAAQEPSASGRDYCSEPYQDAKGTWHIEICSPGSWDSPTSSSSVSSAGLGTESGDPGPGENGMDIAGAINASIGLFGNFCGMAFGLGLIGVPEPTFASALLGSAILGKSLYGFGANFANLGAALFGRNAPSKGSLANDIAGWAAPGSRNAQNIANVIDLTTDLGGSRAAARAVQRAIGPLSINGLNIHSLERVGMKTPGDLGPAATTYQLYDLYSKGYNAIDGVTGP